MRISGWTLAFFMVVVSLVGIFGTDTAIAVRRSYYATPGRFYAAGAVRLAMGLLLIFVASGSRSPKILRAMGAVMCLQAMAANIFGIERARAIMEWETMQGTTALRAGAVVSLACGVLIAFAFRRGQAGRPVSPEVSP